MRKLVMLISKQSRKINPDFLVVPQNALELITTNGKYNGEIAQSYISAIDGVGCEELFYGKEEDGEKTPAHTTTYFLNFLLKLKKNNKYVFAIDYVNTTKQARDSFMRSKKYGFLSFQGERSLSKIPPWTFNNQDMPIENLANAKNFLYLLDGSKFNTPDSYIRSLKKTNKDIFIIDGFYWGKILTKKQVQSLKRKPSGTRRMVLAYFSIGEAEEYRYYWNAQWKSNPPPFLARVNPEWKGNYKVKYWMDEWKEIICGREDGTGFEKSYLKKIIDAGFDGVYLDILDAAFYFERHRN